MPRIYTRTGDARMTGIQGGVRLTKHSARIEALGSLDELNSFLGFLLALSNSSAEKGRKKKVRDSFSKIIETIQRDLFITGAELSKPLIKNNSIPHPLRRHYPKYLQYPVGKVPVITHREVQYLEELIDRFHKILPPLKHFILPQGDPVGAFSQVIRAICRRTERRVVQLAMHSKVNPLTLAYLNRLSDLFFLLARAQNYRHRISEIIWKHDRSVNISKK